MLAGQVASALGTLVGLRLVTGVVAPAIYGVVVLAMGIKALAQGLAVGPMMQAALRHYTEYERDEGKGVLRRTVVGALRQPLLWLSAGLLLAVGFWSNQIHAGLVLGPLCVVLFLIDATRTVEVTFLNAARDQRTMSQLVAADAWMRPVGAVIAVSVLGPSAAAVVAGYAVGAAVPLLAFYALRRTGSSAPLAPQRERASVVADRARMWLYARPLVLLPLVGWVSGQADRYIVGGLAGLAFAGVYAAVYGLASRPFLVLGNTAELALRQVYYARVSEGNRVTERRIFFLWMVSVSGAALLLVAAVALVHRQIALLLLAPEYRGYSSLMIWIAVGYGLAICGQVVERVCYALRDTRGVLLIEAGGAVLSVIVAVPMVLLFGIRGAAWAVPVYFGLQLCLAAWRAAHALKRRAKGELQSAWGSTDAATTDEPGSRCLVLP